jgi:hypothetical protein
MYSIQSQFFLILLGFPYGGFQSINVQLLKLHWTEEPCIKQDAWYKQELG